MTVNFTSLSDARRGKVVRIEDQVTQDQTVSGRNIFKGLGVARFDITFPVTFSGRPVPGFGSELDRESALAADNLESPPWATSMVIAWVSFGEIVGAFEGYFTGATVLSKIEGSKDQLTWIDWNFHGPALRNPVGSEDTITL